MQPWRRFRRATRLAPGWVTLFILCAHLSIRADRLLSVTTNDVIGLVGTGDLAAAQTSGHLTALLSVAFPGTKIRNLAWEGDTVFQQRREIGYPNLVQTVKKSGATILLVQYGRMESFAGKANVSGFIEGYQRLLDQFASNHWKVCLLGPIPFEAGPGNEARERNTILADYSASIANLAKARKLPFLDLFTELQSLQANGLRLTSDGLQLTPLGQAYMAAAIIKQLGFTQLATKAGPASTDGKWSNPKFDELRFLAIEKDRLWFDYYRPQNWAFLGGDRTSQPSSRDHLNPSIRWFPNEIEQFLPLLQSREEELNQSARNVGGEK